MGMLYIWVMWNKDVFCIEEIMQSSQCKGTSDVFLLTAIYAHNHENDRAALGNDWTDIAQSVYIPWIVLGDFNCFLNSSEKVKGGIEVGGQTKELQNLLASTDLGDMEFHGHFLTWCNQQEGDCRTYVKLDRLLINRHWYLSFKEATATFLPPAVSDHCPAIVSLEGNSTYKGFPFRFCNAWTTDDRFRSIVSNVWESNIQGCHMYRLAQKLKTMKKLKAKIAGYTE